ncbi:glycosyltransferase involved in cell wall biosynthesis [Streptomyces sp. PanSC19]|uniref:glycosyltransferase family 2 protein n=1 Tax=Streptomyces sp. PanSC19 TaxID=1520455 RepID=UPI000F4954AF|nr:glycosyltransferase [Streptomyces sp. PanSC19]ROQ32309.1 glycosyltransferase involved in cell wall biosynthesis [Streptomyces sp. PanSC19]
MSETPRPQAAARVSVVVIAYNDAAHVGDAVRSALAQGEAVGEVVVVDDASGDDTAEVLAGFADDPRVRPLIRRENSGGCGTPRNDGIDAAVHPYVLFLDSDDLLLPGAVDGLLAVAAEQRADVVAGICVRRELPEGRETVWAPSLYDVSQGATLPGTVLDGIEDHPEFVLDTLSVNKLYRRDFLDRHAIRFPDGAFHYEDFVFSARVQAASPRLAVTDVPVYVWHVRRQAATLSISLRRASLANWEHRIAAHASVVEVFRTAGRPALARAAQTKFLDYDLPMYLRELPQRTAAYRADWWTATRAHLAGFEAAAVADAQAPGRWLHAGLAALPAVPEGRELTRFVELAAPLPRLVPPYPRAGDGAPVLSAAPADVPLEGLAELAPARLPVAVDGSVAVGASTRLTLTVHDLYGRVAELRPTAVRVVFTERVSAAELSLDAPLLPAEEGWTATVSLPTAKLLRAGRLAAWSLRAELRYADGSTGDAEVRAPQGFAGRRGMVLGRLGRVLLVQVVASARRGLVLRFAGGAVGARQVVSGRFKRLFAMR